MERKAAKNSEGKVVSLMQLFKEEVKARLQTQASKNKKIHEEHGMKLGDRESVRNAQQ